MCSSDLYNSGIHDLEMQTDSRVTESTVDLFFFCQKLIKHMSSTKHLLQNHIFKFILYIVTVKMFIKFK